MKLKDPCLCTNMTKPPLLHPRYIPAIIAQKHSRVRAPPQQKLHVISRPVITLHFAHPLNPTACPTSTLQHPHPRHFLYCCVKSNSMRWPATLVNVMSQDWPLTVYPNSQMGLY
jgi:hypothetical protein